LRVYEDPQVLLELRLFGCKLSIYDTNERRPEENGNHFNLQTLQ
jgi:hypothetical protein